MNHSYWRQKAFACRILILSQQYLHLEYGHFLHFPSMMKWGSFLIHQSCMYHPENNQPPIILLRIQTNCGVHADARVKVLAFILLAFINNTVPANFKNYIRIRTITSILFHFRGSFLDTFIWNHMPCIRPQIYDLYNLKVLLGYISEDEQFQQNDEVSQQQLMQW